MKDGLSQELMIEERLDIIGTEYDIPLEQNVKEEMGQMCNLSDGIEERGIERGMKMGVEIGIERIVLNMYQQGFALEQIASVANKTVEEVKAIVEAKEAVLV